MDADCTALGGPGFSQCIGGLLRAYGGQGHIGGKLRRPFDLLSRPPLKIR